MRPAETELLFNDAPANDNGNQNVGNAAPPGVGFGDFLRVLIVLAIVIALIYALVWMLKRFSGMKSEGLDVIHLYATQPLKGDSALHLVEAGKRIFLIGSSGSSINLISEIDDKESVDEIRLKASSSPPRVNGGFSALFKDKFGTQNSEPVSDEEVQADPASFLRKQRERLKKL